MSELGNEKNEIKNFFEINENQGQNAACEQKTTSEKEKIGSKKKSGLEWIINGLEKPFRKKIRSKKSEKRKSKTAACEQKNH